MYFLNRVPLKNVLLISTISISYLVLMFILVGYKSDQLILVALFNVLYYLSQNTRKFIIGYSVFIVFWIIFDSMKAFPNYNFNKIHIEDLYNLEKNIFGIKTQSNLLVTPNEFAAINANRFLDFLSGLFYINWVPVPLFMAFYLFYSDKKEFLNFSLTFLLVNLIGFTIYYIFPAAPPWYVKEYGFNLKFNTPGNAAGLLRFDNLLNINLFKSLYSKSSNVFAAMPSLHSAYPVVTLFYGIKNNLGKVNILLVVFMLGIWFSAIYSGHHYILDVITGVLCAIIGIFLYINILANRSWFRSFLFKYVKLIT